MAAERGVLFVNACGKTIPLPFKCKHKFEDEWGNTTLKEIPQPDIVHFFYEHAPLIDEHNKAQQSVIALEKQWEMQSPWFWLLTTVLGLTLLTCVAFTGTMCSRLKETISEMLMHYKQSHLLIGFV